MENNIQYWAKLINENYELNEGKKLPPEDEKLLVALQEFFKTNTEVTVDGGFNDDPRVTVGFDNSGYDNRSYASQEFEEILNGVDSFLKDWNEKNGTSFTAEPFEDEWYIDVAQNESENVNEVSDIDVDQQTWKNDMGRADDRFYNEYLKKVNQNHTELANKIQKMDSQQFTPIFLLLVDMLENSFDTKAGFEKMIKDKFENKYRRYQFSSLEREILDTIAHQIGERHYQDVEHDIKKELD